MSCLVCRPAPKWLRDDLLTVFAGGNEADPRYPLALAYARWGAARQARGESVPWPLPQHRPGKLAPFVVARAWFPLALEDFAARGPLRYTADGGQRRSGELRLTPDMKKRLAGWFQEDERAVASRRQQFHALCLRYGSELRADFLLSAFGPGTPAWRVYLDTLGGHQLDIALDYSEHPATFTVRWNAHRNAP
jgi:hypothetical protein